MCRSARVQATPVYLGDGDIVQCPVKLGVTQSHLRTNKSLQQDNHFALSGTWVLKFSFNDNGNNTNVMADRN